MKPSNPLFYSPSTRKLKAKRAAKNRKHVNTTIQRKRSQSINPLFVIGLLIDLLGRNGR